ncbi:uncharacterized protein BX664DRAFT_200379 [Halteromyces radiatus]|uniref:uncharacterized protein n=1 Tax=Halteromyces radiatus TaxID=101107 RepID=UPI00221E3A6E|nr:uncharacterized protein BX664DRAFT_200379 [Halteromyces radiatus]KAI8081759.1 hypothetical protein BX664DRAFT_200379 [Halteromyces radiatus]
MEAEQLIIEDELLELMGINEQDIIQPRSDYEGMSVIDIITYKKRWKRQQTLLQRAQRQQIQLGEADNDDDSEEDEPGDDESVSTRGSSSKQLAGSKRKRKQGGVEKALKRRGQQQRKVMGQKKSIKPCQECLRNDRFDTAYTHSRTTSRLCPFHGATRLQLVQQRVGRTSTVCRKIGLKTILNVDVSDQQRVLDGINDVVSYVRNIIIKSHLFITFYVYNCLTNHTPITKQLFTKSFFYAVFQQISGATITVNNTIDQRLALAIRDSYHQLNQTPARIESFGEQQIHGKRYSDVVSSAMDHYVTSFTNRIVEDITQWMANLYSLRVSELNHQHQQQQQQQQQQQSLAQQQQLIGQQQQLVEQQQQLLEQQQQQQQQLFQRQRQLFEQQRQSLEQQQQQQLVEEHQQLVEQQQHLLERRRQILVQQGQLLQHQQQEQQDNLSEPRQRQNVSDTIKVLRKGIVVSHAIVCFIHRY